MIVTKLRTQIGGQLGSAASSNSSSWSDGRMYAIAFDLNQAALREYYKGPYHQNAYDDIYRELMAHGFKRQQGSLYFGGPGTTPVTCVMAVQALRDRYPWFQPSVTDLRMLRIEENNDLMPAIGQGKLPLDKSDAA